ncbi:MAG: hypothetical protein ACOC3V_03875, partial [bacterium]
RESLNESQGTSLYGFIGRTTDWDSNVSDILVDSIETQYNVWSDMIYSKRIYYSDVSFVVPRIDWSSGSNFVQYDPRNYDFHSSNSYCHTSNNKVYICISNNDGSLSTVEPNGEGTSPEETADGYKWQYLYKIDSLSGLKFMDVTGSWIPVLENEDLQTGATKGRVVQINVSNTGEYLTYNHSGYDLTISSDTGTNLEATVTLQYDGGIKSIDVTDAGTYNETSCTHSLAAISSTGSGFTGTIYLESDGSANSETITISNSGSNYYDSNTTIYIANVEDPVSNAVFSPNVKQFVVDDVTITNQGQNYRDVTITLDHPSIETNAVFQGVINPAYGLGYNMVNDLWSQWLMYNMKTKEIAIDDDLMGGNSYRMIGLIVDPQDRANNCTATRDTYNQTTTLDLTGMSVTSYFKNNELITQDVSNATGTVVWHDNTNHKLYVYKTAGTFTTNEQISSDTASSNGIASITQPGLIQDLGDIIYLEYLDNDDAIERQSNQGENHIIVLKY